ncbi:DNA-binding transcriptional MocR family regulator [Pseudomonas sp. JUb42]|jgi:DNA-binding transcriptional MocR family regulator|uniref:aminotransferase-like domain-containing protein n=1 Tax=Pseudomonas sp. JUb42 TaxID=2940611 RepID=UPI00216833C8|nr:PLP-dependent aminotransferase family protein [Pseudomonas sp. JUb42]MCS3469063.1 DNA-binding transcriptional MocR family regulator [Pseudomonas sp. JUb42]
MTLIRLSSNLKMSLVEQIVEQLGELINQGTLRPGSKMTSIRLFARQHQVSAHTVTEAYERLVALGHIESRPRSGFFVRRPRRSATRNVSQSPFAKAFDHLWQLRAHLSNDDGLLNVSSGRLPPQWLDSDMLRVSLKSAATRLDSDLMQYGDPYGYLPLRNLLQTRLSDLGIHTPSSQLLLTDGTTQAVDLIMRYLLRPGDSVLVDDPGYFNLFSNLQLQGIEALPVPRTADGPDIQVLEELARTHRPKVMFTQSVLHTPTGSTTSPGHAYRLLRLAEEYDFNIVENDTYADFLDTPSTRIAALDQLHRVFYVGSFSKTLSAAARVGFIAAPEAAVRDLCSLKMITSITSSQINERLVFHALTEGHYRRSLERLRTRLAERLAHTEALLESMGFELFCRPLGGKFVWARHPAYESSDEIWRLAAAAGIVLAPGKVFRSGMPQTPWFRLNVCCTDEPALLAFLQSISHAASCPGN